MRYLALACDYDGTLAHHGTLDTETIDALERVKKSGRKLLMVTGRQIDDLSRVCPRLDLFDRIVAENGGLLVRPSPVREELPLGPPPPPAFVEALRKANVPVETGRVIAATWTPHDSVVLRVIKEQGLELQIIFNKGAVMVLPAGINKATGLRAALAELGLSTHNCIAAGDAENDHAFLGACEVGVAVANALPSLKERADVVTRGDHGHGIVELVDALLADDLATLEPRLARHRIPLGDNNVDVAPYGRTLLIAGSSGGGKTTTATALLERVNERGYQFCVIDPEGDYTNLSAGVSVGDTDHAPPIDEVVELLAKKHENVCVNLLGIPLAERPAFLESLLPRLIDLRARTARPHFLVVDEAHHMLPKGPRPNDGALFLDGGIVLITVHPEEIAPNALAEIDDVVVIGQTPAQTLAQVSTALAVPLDDVADEPLPTGAGYFWTPPGELKRFTIEPPKSEGHRHRRKYAEGELGPDKSFWFRGPEDKLNLRAQNLILFVQLAAGVDDDTWLHHLHQRDYSRWFRDAIKDPQLADAAARIEGARMTAAQSRDAMAKAINERYTLPAATATAP